MMERSTWYPPYKRTRDGVSRDMENQGRRSGAKWTAAKADKEAGLSANRVEPRVTSRPYAF
ncbi:hypothetical protein [Peribacillus glennii]|uniref:hypothetical protein n=1 Tax=Peribacillus glennii TaxID=2303991 RepID=UPI00115C979B|nr:hypothetical protein [Peribacillus glennii]